MKHYRLKHLAPVMLLMTGLLLAACSGASLETVETATLRIVAPTGSLRQPDGTDAAEIAGSGFIFDETGLAVVPHHLVTGVSNFSVFIGEEQTTPVQAQVVGVAECHDLAILQLPVQDDDYPALELDDELEIEIGETVSVADRTTDNGAFTLIPSTIVRQAGSAQNSQAAGNEGFIQYNPSFNVDGFGGPLLDEKNRLLGYTYLADETGAPHLALGVDTLYQRIQNLREGPDPFNLGINGQATAIDRDGQLLTGLWVRAVAPGSPAERAGIQGGDIITHLGDVPLAADGTLRAYCDTVLNREPGSELRYQLVRLSTNEQLNGAFFSSQPLPEPTPTIVAEPTDEGNSEPIVTPEPTPEITPNPTAPYTLAVDDLGVIQVDVPGVWGEINGQSDRDSFGAVTSATINANAPGQSANFRESRFAIPGLRLVVPRDSQEPTAFLDSFGNPDYLTSCEGPQRLSITDHPRYSGALDVYLGCDPNNSTFLIAAFTTSESNQNQFVSLVSRNLSLTDLYHVLDTLEIGSLP
ncbi:MAG: trypsin-like peptidase domain-containing protein [Anaerolineae bacterium]|nr:trypsin-like peptidase domain-containing protein [Anaerolineae bacterium]